MTLGLYLDTLDHPRIPRGDSARHVDVASGITPGYPRMIPYNTLLKMLLYIKYTK